MGITFDVETHTYRNGGAKVPSVTQIMAAAGLGVSPYFNSAAAARGTAVHQETAYLDGQVKDLAKLAELKNSPVLCGYVKAWIAFRLVSKFQPTAIEETIFHERLRYAGRIDRVGVLNGRPVVIDIKTGVQNKAAGVQLAAYAAALSQDKPSVHGLIAVYLGEFGDFVIKDYTPQWAQFWNVFQAALVIHQFQEGA
jgi:hypothetical protein